MASRPRRRPDRCRGQYLETCCWTWGGPSGAGQGAQAAAPLRLPRYFWFMSEVPQGPGWWRAFDGRWYPPEQRPLPPPPPTEGMFYPPMAYAPSPATNGMAIASMVLGILWIYWVGLV